ncbi:MAG: FAD-dependent oxidoreductase [Acidobacteria bacterium]|nr:FAD-dependent oxidoreductase [Acidobacteriota bacterium]
MNKHEAVLYKLSEINDGEMKEISIGETPILLTRVNGKCNAIGARCTHYGAPLVDGALVDGKIICPWHHACFNAETGDLVEPPALDALPNYPLRIDGDDIYIEISDDMADRRTPQMAIADTAADTRLFAILGGGAAGYMAAQTLREDGFTGRILLITGEKRTSYDRPNLSKDYLFGEAEPEWMPLRSDEFYEDHGIEILLSRTAVSLDASAKTITFSDGQEMIFDRLLIATGGAPRSLNLPGASLRNIFTLRSFDSADEIIAAAEDAKRAVIIGASFIGMEAAASLRKRGLSVTVVAPDTVPFERTLGPEIGALFRRMHESNGVEFRLEDHAVRFEGEGKVQSAVLASGEILEADLVLIGVGVTPATGFLHGFELHKDGGVIADKHLRIADDIYAAGDIVHFPDARSGESFRIEHWRTALQQGRIAAHNMAGIETVYDSVPFFWTRQFDSTLNYVGHAKAWDEIVFDGDVTGQDFLAFYVKDGRVLAVAGMNRDRELAQIEELMKLDRMPAVQTLKDGGIFAHEASVSQT